MIIRLLVKIMLYVGAVITRTITYYCTNQYMYIRARFLDFDITKSSTDHTHLHQNDGLFNER